MSPAVRLAWVALAVGGTFGGAAVVGHAVGPIQQVGVGELDRQDDDGSRAAGQDHSDHLGHTDDSGKAAEAAEAGAADDEAVDPAVGLHTDQAGGPELPEGHAAPAVANAGGLSISDSGYTLEPEGTTLSGAPGDVLRFRISGPVGAVVHDFEVHHERELHLVLVGRNLTSYAHVHPTLAPDGTWSAELPALRPGSYRAFADFVVVGGPALTLGVDLLVPGEVHADPLPEPWQVASVDGYEVTLDGPPIADEQLDLTFTVQRDGVPVTDLEPYLGAFGHLVAIRSGDLAYVHIHPGEFAEPGQGPTVPFQVELPSPGTYRLFFEFAHWGAVHTADFTIAASAPAAGVEGAAPDGTDGAASQGSQDPVGGDGHDHHGLGNQAETGAASLEDR